MIFCVPLLGMALGNALFLAHFWGDRAISMHARLLPQLA